jgi:hypothetical protein
MGGGLMQLVAYGAQDIYLTGNPQITFFKVVYRRHTNFSMESIQQTINGTSTLTTSNSSGTVTISRNGDLVHNIYVRVDANDGTDCISGDQVISEVELEIGGQRIDKHTREWLQVWSELTVPDSKAAGYKYLTGGFSNTLMAGGTTGGHSQQSVMVPLQFWFCRNPGLALPLIALQYHEVKVKLTWGTTTEVSRSGAVYGAAPTCEVWVDYIYLDTDERRRFAQQSHEYLIEQLQYQTEGTANSKYKLNFNHPVKELIWTNTSSDITTQKTKITLNGHDRFSQQDREYFQVRQPLDHHTAVPGFNIKERETPQMLSVPISVCQLTPASATEKITGNAGSITIALAAAHQTNTISDNVKVGDTIYVEVIRAATSVADTAAVPVAAAGSRNSVSAYLYVTATTATTIVGTISGLVGGGGAVTAATNADTGKIPAIETKGVALTTTAFGLTAMALAADASDATTAAITVDTVSPFGLLLLGEQLYKVDGGDFGALTVITSNTVISRSLFKLDGSTCEAVANDDAICVATELINITVIGRVQNAQSRCSQLARDINCYSFALKPEEHQPSGTCNFSRIDTAHLEFDASANVENIYAVNYNVLRIMSGMGGLAYSN